MIRTLIFSFLVVSLACAGPVAAQDDVVYNPQAETQFILGVRQYTQQEFKSAYQTLKQVADMQPVHQRTTASFVMAAKAANGAGQCMEAAALCQDFLDRFPNSSYVEDAHYTLGTAYQMLERRLPAASEMLTVLNDGQDRVTRWRACERLESLAQRCSPAELGTLEAQATNDSARVVTMLLRAEAYARAGRADSAEAAARRVADKTVDKKILRRAQHLFRTAAAGPADTLTVGVLLPFMHHFKAATREQITSEEIMKGIRVALQEYRDDASALRTPIRLDVRDSQRNKEHIEGIIEEWRNDSTVVVVLGPLFSDETMAAAAKANAARIPLLSPTATGNNIASIGAYVFQANPDYAMRGTLMAQYAVRIAGFVNLAVMTTEEPPGSLVAEAFAKEVKRLGANMISYQHYAGGVTDYRHLFRAMKSDAASAKKGALQAVYCPIASSADIGAVTSQLRVFDANLVVLGTDEWNDDEELDRNKISADGVVFSSDRWESGDDSPISGLSFESFGYDAASLLFRCFRGSETTSEALQRTLSSVRVYDGIHSKISFMEQRVNGFLHILQYKNGFIKKIAEMEYRQ